MPPQLGRKPRKERIYITSSVGMLVALLLFFLPIYPATLYLTIPGEVRQVNTSDINPGTLTPNQVIEVRTPAHAREVDTRRSIFDVIYYQSNERYVTLHHPWLSLLFFLGVSLSVTFVTWLIVNAIYKRIEEPFAR